MVSFYGDYNTTETVVIPFNTFTSDDPSASVTITDLAAADVMIHKDGGATQRSSAAGVTVSIDFDSITGNHIVSIDLSDNTDAGFYANGSRYQVRMEGTTVDGATINAWIGAFSIGCVLRPATPGQTLNVANGKTEADLTYIHGTALTETATQLAGAFVQFFDVETPTGTVNSLPNAAPDAAGGLPTTTKITDARLGALTDWIDGGRLDLLLDAVNTVAPDAAGTAAGLVSAMQTHGDSTWATATGFSTLDAAGVRTAVGLASANLDTQLSGLSGYVDCLPATLDGSTFTSLPEVVTDAASRTASKADVSALALEATLTAIKGATFDTGTDSLEALRNRGDSAWITATAIPTVGEIDTELTANHGAGSWASAGSGSGARTVTITVDDGSDALESAKVRVTKGVLSYVQATDVDGQVTFNLDDGTWTIAISLAGYTYSGTSLVVDGDETETYSMTAQTISAPTDASLCTVQFRVKVSATAVEGAVCKAKLLGVNQASDGTVLSNQELSDTTDAQGVAELALVQKGSLTKGKGLYDIRVEIDGKPVASVQTAIPNQSTILFEALL